MKTENKQMYLIIDILEHICSDLEDEASYQTQEKIAELRELIGYGENGNWCDERAVTDVTKILLYSGNWSDESVV